MASWRSLLTLAATHQAYRRRGGGYRHRTARRALFVLAAISIILAMKRRHVGHGMTLASKRKSNTSAPREIT